MTTYESQENFDHFPDPGPNGFGNPAAAEKSSKSPLLGNLSIFKGLGSEKKLKADGQPPKRRGPKPDSKPALTRRQELNRQAQRTHRERKEMYIKALEQEVMRLKETYGDVTRQRDAFAEENRRLKEILAAHGISVPTLKIDPRNTPGAEPSSSGSYSVPPSSSSDLSPGPTISPQPGQQMQHQQTGYPQNPNANINYDQVGIDFVLSLERPCMDHMQMLCVRSQNGEEEISGHALMATCPTATHLIERPDVQYPHQMPDGMNAGDLLKLLDLSNRLPLDGEITPIMAWALILRHQCFDQLSAEEFNNIKETLLPKVRCYGFGAVLEEFEVLEVLDYISSIKSNAIANLQI